MGGSGESVMVEVATAANLGEYVPVLLRVPYFSNSVEGYSMLGLGDIFVPGLLLTFTRVFDVCQSIPL